jgi:hypothetical protein
MLLRVTLRAGKRGRFVVSQLLEAFLSSYGSYLWGERVKKRNLPAAAPPESPFRLP